MGTKRTMTVRQMRELLRGFSGECELTFRVCSYKPGDVSSETLENPIVPVLSNDGKKRRQAEHAVISFWRNSL